MKARAANQLGTALVLLVIAVLLLRGAQLRSFLTFTDKKSWAWEITAFGYMLKIAQDNREQVAGMYWAKQLVQTAIAAFGGGFLAPLVVAHNPVPLQEETFLWMVVLAWYITHNVPILSNVLTSVMQSSPGKVLFTVLFGVFKTNQIVGAVELSVKAINHEALIPQSRYFGVPIAAPILCGFLGGCGGAFLPLSKGLAPIEEGKNWSVRASFVAPCLYYGVTRAFGADPISAKMSICLMRIFGDLLPAPRDEAFEAIASVVYAGTGMRRSPLPTVVKVNSQPEAKLADGRQLGA